MLNTKLHGNDRPVGCSAKHRYRFAYKCLDNVVMYAYAKVDQNIPCGSFESYEYFH